MESFIISFVLPSMLFIYYKLLMLRLRFTFFYQWHHILLFVLLQLQGWCDVMCVGLFVCSYNHIIIISIIFIIIISCFSFFFSSFDSLPSIFSHTDNTRRNISLIFQDYCYFVSLTFPSTLSTHHSVLKSNDTNFYYQIFMLYLCWCCNFP